MGYLETFPFLEEDAKFKIGGFKNRRWGSD